MGPPLGRGGKTDDEFALFYHVWLQWGRLWEEAERGALTTGHSVTTYGVVFERFVFLAFPAVAHGRFSVHNV